MAKEGNRCGISSTHARRWFDDGWLSRARLPPQSVDRKVVLNSETGEKLSKTGCQLGKALRLNDLRVWTPRLTHGLRQVFCSRLGANQVSKTGCLTEIGSAFFGTDTLGALRSKSRHAADDLAGAGLLMFSASLTGWKTHLERQRILGRPDRERAGEPDNEKRRPGCPGRR
jgi:hypothetical protein